MNVCVLRGLWEEVPLRWVSVKAPGVELREAVEGRGSEETSVYDVASVMLGAGTWAGCIGKGWDGGATGAG